MKSAALWAATVAALVGCAHVPVVSQAKQDLRGSVRVAATPRLLVVGPVAQVHTSVAGGKPVVLFVVDAITGDDADCAASTRPPRAVLTEAPRLREVPAGRELCVAAAGVGPPSPWSPSVWTVTVRT